MLLNRLKQKAAEYTHADSKYNKHQAVFFNGESKSQMSKSAKRGVKHREHRLYILINIIQSMIQR